MNYGYELARTMLLFHFLPLIFLVLNVYTTIPVGVKAYFSSQIVATIYIVQTIAASVTSVTTFIGAYLWLFTEGIAVICFFLIGGLYWSMDEISAGSWIDIDIPGAPTSASGRLSGDETIRGPIIRAKVVVGLFFISLIVARLATVVLPSLPSTGGTLSSAPQTSIYLSDLFYYDYGLVIRLSKIIRLDLYLVIGVISVLVLFPLGRNIGPRNMKYGYLTIGVVTQVVILPVVMLGVFGITISGVTLISPFIPATLTGNVSVISAPIFLIVVVVGAVTRELLRTAEHTYDT